MDVAGFLEEVQSSPEYRGQMAYVREVAPREARFAEPHEPLAPPVQEALRSRGIERLYCHQARAIDLLREGRNVLIVTGTASGKSLCYVVPILQTLLSEPDARTLLLFPTKALCQDQFRGFAGALAEAGMPDVLAGVYDGDTPSAMRRRLRDHASVIFSNPDMLHAGILPQHGRWADFLANLKLLVLDELHVYSGIFGSNAANLFRRFFRVCRHYGSDPQVAACSATIGNPEQLAEGVSGRPMVL
ncbi:MAG: DEAD/DEAH box helicase, partial [Planctomycetota bacterium]